MPTFSDKLAPLADPNLLPFFVFKYFIVGFIFLIISILFSLGAWGAIRRSLEGGYKSKAFLIVCVDILLISFGIWFLNAAFPRLPGIYILVGLGVLFLVTTGGRAVKKAQEGEGGKSDAAKK